MIERLITSAIALLKLLIETQSFSSEEDKTAEHIEQWFVQQDIPFKRTKNNVWATNKYLDPFKAIIEDGKLYGLGSNDAGGCLVSLLATFAYFYTKQDLNFNLVIVASAEEESSGKNGLNSMLSVIPKIDVAIVGEPTLMHLAVAEKGLVVFDAIVNGTPSHAAHPNDDNAIYNTISVLEWFKHYRFSKTSQTLGKVKMTVTQINAGQQHNAVPADVKLVVDVRVNDKYSNQEITQILKAKSPCSSIEARSLRLNSSSIPYGSPTLSDQAVLSCPSLKLGPGNSTRSHTADEFIYISEIEEGIDIYIKLLEKIL